MAQRITLSILLVVASLGCGGDANDDTDIGDGTGDTTGAEAPAADLEPVSPDWGEESPTLTALVTQPNITVYVDGPDRVDDEPLQPGSSALYETHVSVVNTGEGAFQVQQAVIRFEVWDEEGQRTPCADTDDTSPPSLVEEDGAERYRGVARCEFPDAGEYEVRTYVGFEGEELVGDFDLERHYAGRTEVSVGG